MSAYDDFLDDYGLPEGFFGGGGSDFWAGGSSPWGGESIADQVAGANVADYSNLMSSEQDRWNRFKGGFGIGQEGFQDFLSGSQDALNKFEGQLGFFKDLGDNARQQMMGDAAGYVSGMQQANQQMMSQIGDVLGDFTSQMKDMLGKTGGEIGEYESEFTEKFGDLAGRFGESAERFGEIGEAGFQDIRGLADEYMDFGRQALEMADSFAPQVAEYIEGAINKGEEWMEKVGEWGNKAYNTMTAAQNNFNLKTNAQQQALQAGLSSQVADRKAQIAGMDVPDTVKASLNQQLDWQAAEAFQGQASRIQNDHAMAGVAVAGQVAQTALGVSTALNQAGANMTSLINAGGQMTTYAQMNATNMAQTGAGIFGAGVQTAHDFLMQGEKGKLAALGGELQALSEAENARWNAITGQIELDKIAANAAQFSSQMNYNALMAANQNMVNAQSEIFNTIASQSTQAGIQGAQMFLQGISQLLSGSLTTQQLGMNGAFSLADFFASYQTNPVSQSDLIYALGMWNSTYGEAV